ncbi:class 1 fructose-bisphosphatase [Asticcacaulis sp. BYS171W]|uniref:Fructose-1,6-bisphosphatase class 1 n=1 Tax=Asticcacaulis aquaticus TaxID=2984212 RepID=A0ABT5HS79_9CAUL|nr:class 1 fructose-bisphosphatase [Asticcacaulis aquaticus]MDC7682916.1 class 1 fructose-bisphosphatase [Asticcacaulis aquaticus]
MTQTPNTPLGQYLDAAKTPISPELNRLILAMAASCAELSDIIGTSSLNNLQGALEQENVQGEVQKKLDVLSNELFIQPERWHGTVAGIASEEMDTLVPVDADGDYLLIFDPVDGSSNLDVNGTVGTIFSILDAPKAGDLSEADFLRPGTEQVAGGYVLYGPETLMVVTFGQGVAVFGYHRHKNEWLLIRDQVQIPATTREFAINMSNHRHWDAPVQRYIDECVAGKDGARGKDFNMRWLASMVGDVHRIITRGGIFMYPTDRRESGKNGKLRVLYEANPIAFLIEQAGGAAVNGPERILSQTPQKLHQRTGVILGSREEVERVQAYYTEA